MFVWADVHVCGHECGGQRTTLGVAPQTPSNLFFLRQGFSLPWSSLSRLGWLLSGALSLLPQYWDKSTSPYPTFYVGSGDHTKGLNLARQTFY